MSQRVIEELQEAECLECLGQGTVGRFVYQDAEGPAAVPVNYGLAGNEVVFRTERSSHLSDLLGVPVAFEADHVDTNAGEGWSVLIRGTAGEVAMDDVPALLEKMGANYPHPWAEGVHNVWVAIAPRKITGRRLTEPYFAANF